MVGATVEEVRVGGFVALIFSFGAGSWIVGRAIAGWNRRKANDIKT